MRLPSNIDAGKRNALPQVYFGGEGGRERGHLPPPPLKSFAPPLSQGDLPHILSDVFSCYPPRFLICAVHPLVKLSEINPVYRVIRVLR